MSSIYLLNECSLLLLPSTHVILVEEHMQLLYGNPQICLVELVRNVPAERPELFPLLHQRVEETEAKYQPSEGVLLREVAAS